MKQVFCVGLLLAIFLVLGPADADNSPAPVPAGSITFMTGEVFIMPAQKKWIPAKFGASVFEGSCLRTGKDSSCEITMADSSVIRMDAVSEQIIEKADFSDGRKISLFAKAGRLWLNARKVMGRNTDFSVRSDKAVCAIRGTVFGVDTATETTKIAVYQGQVTAWNALPPPAPAAIPGPPYPINGPYPVTMEKWVRIVSRMQQITVDRQGNFKQTNFDKKNKDPWVKWNLNRDQLIQR